MRLIRGLLFRFFFFLLCLQDGTSNKKTKVLVKQKCRQAWSLKTVRRIVGVGFDRS